MKRMAAFLVVGLLLALAGCPGGVKETTIQVSANNDPLNEPRSILKRYSEGQALGSEVASFPNLVSKVRAVDENRANILEKGFADIQKAPPSERAAKAREVLQKIEPQMKAPG